jgi:soluble lytic murein transglycosylase
MRAIFRRLCTALWITAMAAFILIIGVVLLRYAYKQYYSAVYPLQFTDEVTAASEEFSVEPSLIYAIIHTESSFQPQATSSVGAKGLMQLTDSTLEWALSRAGEKGKYSPADLYDPSVNIHYGVYVFSLIRELYDNTDTTLAAYNAGIGRVGGWLKDPAYSTDGVHLELIPYPETDEYVQRVLASRKQYQKLYNLP